MHGSARVRLLEQHTYLEADLVVALASATVGHEVTALLLSNYLAVSSLFCNFGSLSYWQWSYLASGHER